MCFNSCCWRAIQCVSSLPFNLSTLFEFGPKVYSHSLVYLSVPPPSLHPSLLLSVISYNVWGRAAEWACPAVCVVCREAGPPPPLHVCFHLLPFLFIPPPVLFSSFFLLQFLCLCTVRDGLTQGNAYYFTLSTSLFFYPLSLFLSSFCFPISLYPFPFFSRPPSLSPLFPFSLKFLTCLFQSSSLSLSPSLSLFLSLSFFRSFFLSFFLCQIPIFYLMSLSLHGLLVSSTTTSPWPLLSHTSLKTKFRNQM